MADIQIAAGNQFQGGRANVADASAVAPTFIRYAADIDTNTLVFNFPDGSGSSLTFGIPQCLFVDNANNDYEMQVVVSGTQQTFPIPANSTGWYPVDAQQGSTISVTSAGDPTGIVEFIFYNYQRTPFVYYKFGTNQVTVTVPDGADVAMGAVADAPVTNPALAGSLIALTKGLLTELLNIVTQVTASAVSLVSIDGKQTTIATNTGDTANNTDPYNYANYTTNGTKTPKNAPGVFGGIIINTAGGAGTVIIEDGAGNAIATYDSTVAGSFLWGQGATMATNIRAVISGAPNVTVLYK